MDTRNAGFDECYKLVKQARTETPVNTDALHDIRDKYGYALFKECLHKVLLEIDE